ncbi:MAG: hypothetical protein LBE70_00720 [Nitrososphaerota archaeon]|jgi:hypothetical protein|nr:hypothetical protein [Nitrososphaerota archaeon]
MKYIKKLSAIILLVAFGCSLVTLPTTYAATAVNQEKATAFVTNVLLFDMAKYSVTMTQHINEPKSEWSLVDRETFDYTLNADGSTLIVSCSFTDNVFTSCQVISKTGIILQHASNKNLVDTTKKLIENYQTFTGENLFDMIETLAKVDITQNMTTTSGTIKLQTSILHLDRETIQTLFTWTITIDNTDYTTLSIVFANDDFDAFLDNRGIFESGNTKVNITEKQAIDLALKYLETYSYQGIEGTVSGFSVDKERISCKLTTYAYEGSPSVLYPCYTVQLPLEGDYGSTWAILVYIWASSGEAFLGKPLGLGGVINNHSDSQENAVSLLNNDTITIVLTTTIIVTAIALSMIVIKKKRK